MLCGNTQGFCDQTERGPGTGCLLGSVAILQGREQFQGAPCHKSCNFVGQRQVIRIDTCIGACRH